MDQKKFIKTIETVKEIAAVKGNKITKNEISDKIQTEGLNLDESQMNMVYAYLKTSKIDILEESGEEANIEPMDESLETEEVSTLEEKDDEVVKLYQADIKNVIVLNEEELLDVMKKMSQKPDKNAAEKIVNTFLKDVVRWVKKYSEGGVLMTDLIQEGNMGLMLAVNDFDYAVALNQDEPVKKLKEELKKSVIKFAQNALYSQESESNVGYKIAGRVNAVNDCAKQMSEDFGRKVTVEEIAQEMNMTYEEVKEIVELSSNKIEFINNP